MSDNNNQIKSIISLGNADYNSVHNFLSCYRLSKTVITGLPVPFWTWNVTSHPKWTTQTNGNFWRALPMVHIHLWLLGFWTLSIASYSGWNRCSSRKTSDEVRNEITLRLRMLQNRVCRTLFGHERNMVNTARREFHNFCPSILVSLQATAAQSLALSVTNFVIYDIWQRCLDGWL
jgi:hypothetical protein